MTKSSFKSGLDAAYERGRADANTGASNPYSPGSAKAREWKDGRDYEWHLDDMRTAGEFDR